MFDVGIHAGVLSLQHRDAPTALGGVHFALSF
jgi:hypothetical protein